MCRIYTYIWSWRIYIINSTREAEGWSPSEDKAPSDPTFAPKKVTSKAQWLVNLTVPRPALDGSLAKTGASTLASVVQPGLARIP